MRILPLIAVLLLAINTRPESVEIIRSSNSATLVWKTNLFGATLEMSTTSTGCWKNISSIDTPCSEWKMFVVQFDTNECDLAKGIFPTNVGSGTGSVFGSQCALFRLRHHDNGLVPTPYANHATLTESNRVLVDTALMFDCNDNPIPVRFVYRRVDYGATSNLIASLTNSVCFYDFAPTGSVCSYYFQAGDHVSRSLISLEVPEVSIP